jgi:general secretion pathway protein A
MYTQFYNLKSKPFTLLPDPEYLFLSQKHKTALVYLEYGLMNQAGFIVITGEIGTGKTTLIKYFLSELNDTTKVAYVFNTNITPEQFLASIAQEFELQTSTLNKAQLISTINQFLIKAYAARHKVVLIIDEAQNLSFQTLEEIRMLSNLQTEKDYLLQIILIGQPYLRDKLRHPQLRQFLQRVTVNYHLVALNLEETKNYIHHRLKVAQAQDFDLFTENAIHAIYQSSQGIPRLINILCDACLVYGFAEELKRIDEKIVEKVIADKRQGGIFDIGEEVNTFELLDSGAVSTDGLEQRIFFLEQTFSDLQQKVLSTIHNFSQLIEAKGSNRDGSNGAVIEKLENMLEHERKKNAQLSSEKRKHKGKVEYLMKRNEELKEEIVRIKTEINQNIKAGTKNRVFSFFKPPRKGKG